MDNESLIYVTVSTYEDKASIGKAFQQLYQQSLGSFIRVSISRYGHSRLTQITIT